MTMMKKSNKMDFVSKVRKNRRDCNPPVLLQFFRNYICVLDEAKDAVTYNSRHYICVLDRFRRRRLEEPTTVGIIFVS